MKETSGSLSSPVVDELGHEFEDGRGACWVVVPELDGSLQNGHVGWISAVCVQERSQTDCGE